MTSLEVITRLYELGHFHNPKYPTGVTLAELPTLALHDAVVKIAIQSYVEFMTGEQDADPAAPSAIKLIGEPRCGFPDYPYPEGVFGAALEANWPTACRGKLKFGRNFKSLPGLTEAETDQVFIAMTNTWSIALEDVEITISSYQDADIYAGLEGLSGGTLAYSYMANNRCDNRIRQAYDSSRQWSKGLAYPVPTHEVGHALGLNHNNDNSALMYPAIHNQSIDRKGWPNATDLKQAKDLGYKLSGKPQPPLEDLHRPRPWAPLPPDPGDPIPPDKLRFVGEFEAMIGEVSLGKFILVPKPEV